MIDGVKISVKDFDEGHLLNSPELDFLSRVNTDTGELKRNSFGTERREAEYQGLKFIFLKNRVGRNTLLIDGSLHKYFNGGLHNADDFNYNNFLDVLNDLTQRFRLDPSLCRLQNIEFGVNIVPLGRSSQILKGLLVHKMVPFKRISLNNADYYQALHQQFIVKVYDKAIQYPKYTEHHGSLLRIELKYRTMNQLVKKMADAGLINGRRLFLSDLTNVQLWDSLGQILLQKWEEVLMYDFTMNLKNVPNNIYAKTDKWQNQHYWEALDKRKRHRQKKLMYEAFNLHSQNIQTQIHSLIEKKLIELRYECGPIKRIELKEIGSVESGQMGLIKNISKSLMSPTMESLYQKAIEDFQIPDYDESINQPGELPF
jgi:hypothetical protein